MDELRAVLKDVQKEKADREEADTPDMDLLRKPSAESSQLGYLSTAGV